VACQLSLKFFPSVRITSVRKMLPSIFDLGQHFTNFGPKFFNNDFDVSHYLYNSWLFSAAQRLATRQVDAIAC